MAAGYDLFSPVPVSLPPGEQTLIKLGIAWDPPPWTLTFGTDDNKPIILGGFFAKIFDKSGHAYKCRFSTRAGVIDPDYRDEWGLVCVNEGNTLFELKEGKAIAQFVLLPFLLADDLEIRSQNERVGGFGSTGV